MSERTAGEELFEAYLAAHEYPPPEHHPDFGIEKRPDYLVRRDGWECVCEVKEFNPEEIKSPFGDRGGGTTSVKKVLQPIRDKIRSAARQLKPLEGRQLPLVAVLTNPHGAFVPLGVQEMVWAMYGDPVFTIPINPEAGGALSEGRHTTGQHGKLRNDHPYISAIVVVGERRKARDFYEDQATKSRAATREERVDLPASGEVPEGRYYLVDCFKTMSPTATPLPEVFFDGPNDRLFEVDFEQEAFVQVRGREFRR